MTDPMSAAPQARTTPKAAIAVVHLSDLHFGPHHRFRPDATPAGDTPHDPGVPTLLQSLATDLVDFTPGCPVLFCISGDLTQTASPQEFEEARALLQGLSELEIEGRSGHPVVVVPGNHDVEWSRVDPASRWLNWRHFYSAFTGTVAAPGADDVSVELLDLDGQSLVVARINSAAFVQRETPDAERGRVDTVLLDQLDNALASLDPESRRSSIRLAVIHHHPHLIPQLVESGRGYDAVVNSGHLLRRLRRFGFHAVLHGHKHQPFTFTEDARSGVGGGSPTPPMLVVCGGSAGSRGVPVDASANCSNTYNRILFKWLPTLDQARVRVETRALVVFDDEGLPELASRWKWETSSTDDRVLTTPSAGALRTDESGIRRDFDPEIDDDKPRRDRYLAVHDVFPVVSVRPSLIAHEAYEAELVCVRHDPDRDDARPRAERVTWSAGENHPVVTVTRQESPVFRAVLSYWSAMLVEARIEFDDGSVATEYIYANLHPAPTDGADGSGRPGDEVRRDRPSIDAEHDPTQSDADLGRPRAVTTDRASSMIGAMPSQFGPRTFAAPRMTGEWLIARGVLTVPVALPQLVRPRLSAALHDAFERGVSNTVAMEWLRRWSVVAGGEVDPAWLREDPWNSEYMTVRRGASIDRLPFGYARIQVALSSSPVGPRGLYSFVDLALSTQQIAESRSARLDEGVVPSAATPDLVNDEDVTMAVKGALETASACIGIALPEVPGHSDEWVWGAHLWATRELNTFWDLPTPDPPRSIPTDWELSEGALGRGTAPQLDSLISEWIENFKLDLGMT